MAEVFSKSVFFVSISSNIKTVITLLLITGRNTALQGVFEKYRGRNGEEGMRLTHGRSYVLRHSGSKKGRTVSCGLHL